ncbi:MAG TPA: GNAT family N-acetyltransferase [Candidatus Limnocylindrales bacterium]|nr:GNAT family N-acetyltransferase [Candidatus Limnocylindrales bacterium]
MQPVHVPAITVRRAAPADAPAILEIAVAAWRATYAALIGQDAIERFLAQAYTPERVTLRVDRHPTFVAGTGRGIEAFVETLVEPDGRAHIVAFYARPDARGRGLGTALLDAVLELYPDRAITADVLVGNELGEPFYAARGFEPGELIEEEIAGTTIHERRWWLRPEARQAAGAGA